MNKPLIIIGAGGHASVLADILIQQKKTVSALVAPDSTGRGALANLPLWSEDVLAMRAKPDSCLLVNGIGFLPGNTLRASIFSHYTRKGYRFASVVANEAIVSPHTMLGQGVQIMHGAIIQSGASVGTNTLINTGALVEHDALVGDNCHLAPRAVLCGNVQMGNNVFMGCGAVVIQGVQVGDYAQICAGAIVTRYLPEQQVAAPLLSKVIK